jgi:hypothetical protein
LEALGGFGCVPSGLVRLWGILGGTLIDIYVVTDHDIQVLCSQWGRYRCTRGHRPLHAGARGKGREEKKKKKKKAGTLSLSCWLVDWEGRCPIGGDTCNYLHSTGGKGGSASGASILCMKWSSLILPTHSDCLAASSVFRHLVYLFWSPSFLTVSSSLSTRVWIPRIILANSFVANRLVV